MSDGFYRGGLAVYDVIKLGVAMPALPGEEPLIAFPLVLPMGWVNSPPYFCALTETIADLTNTALDTGALRDDPHPLEREAESPPEEYPRPSMPLPMRRGWPAEKQPPLASVDPYVDDFCNLVQGDSQRKWAVLRTLFHYFDDVIRPNDSLDSAARKAPISIKKLLAGDATWATTKVLLGWVIDTLRGTLELPPHRQDRLSEILASVRGKRRVSVRKWHKLLGELRSMTVAIAGSAGLFSHLQEALNLRTGHRVAINKHVAAELDDWQWLADDIMSRPTSIAEVVRQTPTWIGACDSAGVGTGGVCLPLTQPTHPLLWREAFPTAVADALITDDNPDGTLTNNDLEMAGVLCQQDIICQEADIRHQTVGTFNDNTSGVAWTL